jgi:hypothetical protein
MQSLPPSNLEKRKRRAGPHFVIRGRPLLFQGVTDEREQ